MMNRNLHDPVYLNPGSSCNLVHLVSRKNSSFHSLTTCGKYVGEAFFYVGKVCEEAVHGMVLSYITCSALRKNPICARNLSEGDQEVLKSPVPRRTL